MATVNKHRAVTVSNLAMAMVSNSRPAMVIKATDKLKPVMGNRQPVTDSNLATVSRLATDNKRTDSNNTNNNKVMVKHNNPTNRVVMVVTINNKIILSQDRLLMVVNTPMLNKV